MTEDPRAAAEADEPTGSTDEPGRSTDTGGPADGERSGADDATDEAAPRPGAQLQRREGPTRTAPPKRTGVFIDPDDLRVHVGDLLRAFLGSYQVDAFGNFTFTHEDARVFVTVGMSPIGPQVGVFSITNVDLDLTPPLAAFLVTTNHKLGFGSFSYDPESSTVWLRHTLLGTTLDGPELQSAVAAIASTAAHFDDVIRDQFGGRAFHEAPEDVQNRAKPPDPTQQSDYPNASGYL